MEDIISISMYSQFESLTENMGRKSDSVFRPDTSSQSGVSGGTLNYAEGDNQQSEGDTINSTKMSPKENIPTGYFFKIASYLIPH